VVDPSCLVLKGLPSPELYTALLDGSWTDHRWRAVPARVSDDLTIPGTPIPDEGGPLYFRSAAVSDVGRVRSNNEDGFVDRPEAGVWAVADGMGGHSHGEVASRMVCDALTDFPLDGTFEEAIDAARNRVQEVNDHLVRTAAGSDPGERCGSTVVVLLLRGPRSAVLWAGDSRAYRWRGGSLEQLTRDHSLAELAGMAAAESSVITRAVGIEGDLALDLHRDAVQAEDRFLLCSDGLTRVVPESAIRSWMQSADPRTAVEGLVKAALEAGAPDNVTVLIADALRS
jgi:serine/threonine protein phosphatase PrpC